MLHHTKWIYAYFSFGLHFKIEMFFNPIMCPPSLSLKNHAEILHKHQSQTSFFYHENLSGDGTVISPAMHPSSSLANTRFHMHDLSLSDLHPRFLTPLGCTLCRHIVNYTGNNKVLKLSASFNLGSHSNFIMWWIYYFFYLFLRFF